MSDTVETKDTIEATVACGLCTGCGTCAGTCPSGALTMEINKHQGILLPRVHDDRCTRCGLCVDVCPGPLITQGEEMGQVTMMTSSDDLIGKYLQCFLGYATDPDLRYKASSGGLVTAVLLFALEKSLIDGALVTRMRKDTPLEPEPFVARTREEILQATGSKYCPVPANLGLKEILAREGRYAVVGLPCHIAGVRKAEEVDATLRNRVVLHCGIFCSHGVSFGGTEMILDRLGIGSDEVVGISYRGQGWPGGVRIALKDGQEKLIPNAPGSLWDTIFGGFFFTPPRCLACGDVVNEAADLSFGDAWLPDIMSRDRMGTSVVIARSPSALELLKSAAASGFVHLESLQPGRVVQSQRLFTHFKKVGLKWRLKYYDLPRSKDSAHVGLGASLRARLAARLVVMNSRVSPSPIGIFLLRYIPHVVLRTYVRIVRELYRKTMRGDFQAG